MRKFLIIITGLIVVIAIACGVIYFKHPILSKWLSDTARNIGKPIKATVYVNGHVNNAVKVYKDNKFKNDYIASFVDIDSVGKLKYMDLDLEKKMAGRPVSVAKEDYDVVLGQLFMSDIAEHVTDFRQDLGLTFDPKLTSTKNEIKFNIATPALRLDSVRIVLNGK